MHRLARGGPAGWRRGARAAARPAPDRLPAAVRRGSSGFALGRRCARRRCPDRTTGGPALALSSIHTRALASLTRKTKGIVMAQGIHGRFVWQELTTEDPATAVSFYSKVVGWQAHPNASHPDYTEFGIGGRSSAGMMRLSDDLRAAGVRSHWLPYVGVSDVDSSVASARQLGAKVLHGPADI